MAVLKFKTRGMSDPGKKEKVYFCCHPDDFSYFFEGISNEILRRQNCAVWYRDEKDLYDEEDHLLDLSGMQLFVMPVTAKLLNTKNRAIDVEFRFAVENHIPVLPLMQEAGLDALFNEKCGDLQYLDKFNNDDTAISYDEKLTKFLKDVLIGDELAEKIRNAFDAYVFLSYRKKDRKYAQELMRLIHKNDFCRDIAIWYDEFLTPGENFNDSIREALEKSGLFVLAVTPNLVNEENYIMTTEYPMAKKENKPILPAELVPTDKSALCEKYEDIPECTDAHDSVALSDALLESVKKMAIKENDNSPEHNFFIGLAYLSGIDVEVDHERAVKLITSSAEAGLLEAQEKLISMYMSGDGVERSFENAIYWQNKIINAYGDIFKNDKTWENLDTWLSIYISVAGKYSIINRHDESFKVCGRLIELCDSIEYMTAHDKHIDRTRLRYKSQAYMYAAYFCKDMGDINKAREYAKISLDIIEALYNENFTQGSFWVKKNYAASLSYVGETYRLVNEIDKAQEYFTKALDIKKELCEDNRILKDLSLDIEYARSLATVAGIHLLKFENTKAKECYENAMSILECAENENGTWETVPLYIDMAITSSAIYRAAGDFMKMDELLNSAAEKIYAYKDATGVMLYYSAYRVFVSLAQSYTMQKKYYDALTAFERANEINEEYVSCFGKEIDVALACTVYTLRATIAVENGDAKAARKFIQKAAEYADVCLDSGFDIHSADCSAVFSLYSSIELMDENIEQSKVYLKKAITILEKNAFSMDDTRALPMFVVSYMNYTVLSFESGDLSSALEYGLKCIEAYEKYRSMAPGIAERSNITYIYYIVSKVKYQFDKKDGKEFLLEKCAYFENLIAKKGLLIDYDGLSTMYMALSGITGIFERSKWNKKAVSLIEFMETNFPEDFEKTIVSILLNNE